MGTRKKKQAGQIAEADRRQRLVTRHLVQIVLLGLAVNNVCRSVGTLSPPRAATRQLRAVGPHLTEGWIETRLDHFSAADNRTFRQKIAVYDGKWKGPGSPIFLRMPVEAPLNPNKLVQRETVYDTAEQFGALIVSLEHRFYGQSHPQGWSNPTAQQLTYLTVEQSLEDIVAFQHYITEQYATGASKWVTWGGSYPGMLAAYHRVKYPSMSAGAVASSAIAHSEPFSTAPMHYAATHVLGSECTTAYVNASRQMDSMVETQAGRARLRSLFSGYSSAAALSDDPASWYEFMSDMAGFLAYSCGYNYAVVGAYPWKFPAFAMCDLMTAASDKLDAFVSLTDQVCKYRQQMPYPMACSGDLLPRRFFYQMCTELGYAGLLYDNQTGFFSPRLTAEAFVAHCQRQFPNIAPPNGTWSESYITEADLKGSSNLIFSSGGYDPDFPLQPTSNISDTVTAIVVPKAGHGDILVPCAQPGIASPFACTTSFMDADVRHSDLQRMLTGLLRRM
jgi:hypothetical protein